MGAQGSWWLRTRRKRIPREYWSGDCSGEEVTQQHPRGRGAQNHSEGVGVGLQSWEQHGVVGGVQGPAACAPCRLVLRFPPISTPGSLSSGAKGKLQMQPEPVGHCAAGGDSRGSHPRAPRGPRRGSAAGLIAARRSGSGAPRRGCRRGTGRGAARRQVEGQRALITAANGSFP